MPEPVPWLLLSTLPFAPGAVAFGKRFTAPTVVVEVAPRANAPAGTANAARAKTASARVRTRVVQVLMCGCSGGRVNQALKCRLGNARRHATLVLRRSSLMPDALLGPGGRGGVDEIIAAALKGLHPEVRDLHRVGAVVDQLEYHRRLVGGVRAHDRHAGAQRDLDAGAP